MKQALRGLAMLLGAFYALQGAIWLAAPQQAAAGLGMPVLDGVGRSTQFGDFAGFFLTLGASILAGARPGRGHWLFFPAALLGSAALARSLAWAVHGAAFATQFIAVEVVSALILVAAAKQLHAKA